MTDKETATTKADQGFVTSMTGFASAHGETSGMQFSWELKSVNAKGLDIRVRLPGGLEVLEQICRDLLTKHVGRGTIYANFSFTRKPSEARLQINEDALASAHAALKLVCTKTGAAMPDAASILSIKGVCEWTDVDADSDPEITEKAIVACLKEAASAFQSNRAAEGQRLATALSSQVADIERIVGSIIRDPSRTSAVIKERLARQVQLLRDADDMQDEDRLLQEVALLATKADLAEELDRLSSHVAAARDLLQNGGLIGRRFDFLAQEFNREANTICSKSNSATVSAMGVDLKVLIDQMREQVQNIE